MHISKPYWDDHSLLVNAMSPTAGLLEGDHIEIDVHVKSKAALTISNPAALRVHKMSTGEATLSQSFHVATRAFLETNPEWLIPQALSRFTQRTQINLEAGAELLFIEAIAPGRVAHGEQFAFTRFRNSLRLTYDGTLAAFERYDLNPSQNGHAPWNAAGDSPFYGSLIFVSPQLEDSTPLWREIYDLQHKGLIIGCSRLSSGPTWNAKILGKDPSTVRHAIQQIREAFYKSIGRTPTALRRQ